jgi:hypothetical protein
MTWASSSFAVFATLSAVRIIAYIPQIVRICRDENGAVAVSIVTWVLFSASHLATAFYTFDLGADASLTIVFIANTAGCLCIVIATTWKRQAVRRRQPGHMFRNARRLWQLRRLF